MARFLLAEGEDLLARFHPHAVSYAGRYLADLLFLAYGLLPTWLAVRDVVEYERLVLVLFPVFALGHAIGARVLKAPGFVYGLAWAAVGLAAFLLAFQTVPGLPPVAWQPALLGAVAAFVGLVRTEWLRHRNVTHVTNRRVVRRHGLGNLVEQTITLDQIQGVRAGQPPLGQMFHFGDLILTLEAKGRRKVGEPMPHERLVGVPKWEFVKHKLEMALEERRLTPKERAKRAEERRLKDSMQALAGWASERQAP